MNGQTTPSQAEGERDEEEPDSGRPDGLHDIPRTTPSQAEGEDEDNPTDAR